MKPQLITYIKSLLPKNRSIIDIIMKNNTIVAELDNGLEIKINNNLPYESIYNN